MVVTGGALVDELAVGGALEEGGAAVGDVLGVPRMSLQVSQQR